LNAVEFEKLFKKLFPAVSPVPPSSFSAKTKPSICCLLLSPELLGFSGMRGALRKTMPISAPPLLLAVDQVFSKIRNLTCRHLPSRQLFPIEISQYDSGVIRESLHNCIAHQ